jgi:gliding motility-associated-like protein
VTAGQPLASPDTTTVYEVIATSENGCGSDAANVVVTVESTPVVQALSADTVICQGSEIELRATHSFTTTPAGSPVTYRWLPQGSVIGSNTLPVVRVSPSSTTLYTVEASIAGDCPTRDEVLVTVSAAVRAGIDADTTRICRGETVQLSGSGGLGNATFSWSPATGLSDAGAKNPLASPDTTTTYTLVVAEGVCDDTASITIVVNKTPAASYFASQAAGCAGLEVSFLENSPGAVAYRWDFGDGSAVNNEANPSYTYTEAGTYPVTLTVVGEGGCESSITSTTVVTTDGAFADYSADPGPGSRQPLPGAEVRFTSLAAGAVSWFWDFGDGKTSAESNPVHRYSEAGDYSVTLTVTDGNGCVSSVSYGSFSVYAPELLIPNVVTPNGDGVNDAFEVLYTGKERFFLKVFDRWGTEYFSTGNPNQGWTGQNSGGAAAKEGVYFYQLEIGDKSYSGNVTLLR